MKIQRYIFALSLYFLPFGVCNLWAEPDPTDDISHSPGGTGTGGATTGNSAAGAAIQTPGALPIKVRSLIQQDLDTRSEEERKRAANLMKVAATDPNLDDAARLALATAALGGEKNKAEFKSIFDSDGQGKVKDALAAAVSDLEKDEKFGKFFKADEGADGADKKDSEEKGDKEKEVAAQKEAQEKAIREAVEQDRRNRLVDEDAARRRQAENNAKEKSAGSDSGSTPSSGATGQSSGTKGGDNGRDNRNGLNTDGLKHIFDKLGATKPESSSKESSVAQQLADALQNNKDNKSSSTKGRGFLDDNDLKPKSTPSPTPPPVASNTDSGSSQVEVAGPPPPSDLPPTIASASNSPDFPAAGGGGDGGGGGSSSPGLGNIGGGGASGADLLAGGNGLFGAVGQGDNYTPMKYNYVKFGEGDFIAAAGGEGSSSNTDVAAAGSDTAGKSGGKDSLEQILGARQLAEAGCTNGIMCFVGKMVKNQCKQGRSRALCAKTVKSVQGDV